MSSWSWPGTHITRVLDGDTVDCMVSRDLGFNGWVTFPVRLRLDGINAPALKTKKGKAAASFLRDLIEDRVFDVTTLKPYKYGGPADAAGEFMATITLPDGRDVSAVLVEAGYAVPWTGQGARPADG